jgi:hypothetical protein
VSAAAIDAIESGRDVVKSCSRLPATLAKAFHALGRKARAVTTRAWTGIGSSWPRRFGDGVGGTALACIAITLGVKLAASPRKEASASARAPVTTSAIKASAAIEPATRPISIPTPVQTAIVAPSAAPAPSEQPSRASQVERLQNQLSSARERCLARLYATEEYRSLKAEHDRLEARVRKLRRDDPLRELPAASVQWIQAKSELRRITDEALQADLEVSRAQRALSARSVGR